MQRPMPPDGMGRYNEYTDSWNPSFVPALDMPQWIRNMFIGEDSQLKNDDHSHLENADIAFLWAGSGFKKQMRQVIGMAEEVTFRCGRWQKGRQEQQMMDWYGRVPNWLITLDASYCSQCTDEQFCALVEHELYHIGHAFDDYGVPKFDSEGLPVIKMRGHDVEEFVGVVERYGVGNPEGSVAKMVEAANKGPKLTVFDITHCCGTCVS